MTLRCFFTGCKWTLDGIHIGHNEFLTYHRCSRCGATRVRSHD